MFKLQRVDEDMLECKRCEQMGSIYEMCNCEFDDIFEHDINSDGSSND